MNWWAVANGVTLSLEISDGRLTPNGITGAIDSWHRPISSTLGQGCTINASTPPSTAALPASTP
ncbi:MAG: hypothetical protein R2867_03105 [Caldilineaceae bacterium]